ncbi:MAG: 5-formyltetrahydrofolate cyclo-ligase [Desulfuromonas sp.]|nr:5-formyltetrahydrofolate cyclo-ligase [Desulfuromonas sp.]
MPKYRIRKLQLQTRGCLSATQRSSLSYAAQQRLLHHNLFAAAGVIALYAPIRCEVDTSILMEAALAAGKSVVYPRIVQGKSAPDMHFVEINSVADLQPGAFGVLEPQGCEVVAVANIDLMVVPGVAFDRAGYRLGYGKGFYDRAVSSCCSSCALVGLGYAFQLEESLPHEEHDLVLDWLITDHEVLDFTHNI